MLMAALAGLPCYAAPAQRASPTPRRTFQTRPTPRAMPGVRPTQQRTRVARPTPSPTRQTPPARGGMAASGPQRSPLMSFFQPFEQVFGRDWRTVPMDLTGYGDGAASPPRYSPARGMLPSQQRRLERLTAFGRILSVGYIVCYLVFLLPVFPFGAYRLTLFEHAYHREPMLAGDRVPLALRRARRIYKQRSPKAWSPLAGLPAGATVSFPSPRGGARISSVIAERYEFVEPENMGQWRLYVFQAPAGADADCLLVFPAQPGDWKRVRVRGGRVHSNLPTAQSPIGWPPASQLSILGTHGWPSEYALSAASWPKRGINPLSVEMNAVVRRWGDPPGRQYQPRTAAYWSYKAVAGQEHPPVHQFLDIFLIADNAIIIETNPIDPRGIEFDLGADRSALALILP